MVWNQCILLQCASNGRFEAFDFGISGNWERYNQSTPPPYRLDFLGVPITVYWGGEVWVATSMDTKKILAALRKNAENPEVRVVFVPRYNHMDFVWGLDAAVVIYPDIIKFFEKYL